MDDVFAEHGLDQSLKTAVLTDLKNFYDGYRFVPGAEPLYNATICNWYLRCLVVERKQPSFIIDANVRTDIGWFRRLAQTNARALERMRAYVERGEGECVVLSALSTKFGRRCEGLTRREGLWYTLPREGKATWRYGNEFT